MHGNAILVFFYGSMTGWSDKCRPCLVVDSKSTVTTNGDADSPWSCETT